MTTSLPCSARPSLAPGVRLFAGYAAFDPGETVAHAQLGVDIVHVERQGPREPGSRVPQSRLLLRGVIDAAQHLDHIGAQAGHLDADRERCAVAVVDGPSFGLDVQPALPLLLGDLA